MSAADLDRFIEDAGAVLDLPIDPAWKPGIRANLEAAFRLAALVSSFELPDDAEPGPVFRA